MVAVFSIETGRRRRSDMITGALRVVAYPYNSSVSIETRYDGKARSEIQPQSFHEAMFYRSEIGQKESYVLFLLFCQIP